MTSKFVLDILMEWFYENETLWIGQALQLQVFPSQNFTTLENLKVFCFYNMIKQHKLLEPNFPWSVLKTSKLIFFLSVLY